MPDRHPVPNPNFDKIRKRTNSRSKVMDAALNLRDAIDALVQTPSLESQFDNRLAALKDRIARYEELKEKANVNS